jgi:hypothetical protein
MTSTSIFPRAKEPFQSSVLGFDFVFYSAIYQAGWALRNSSSPRYSYRDCMYAVRTRKIPSKYTADLLV